MPRQCVRPNGASAIGICVRVIFPACLAWFALEYCVAADESLVAHYPLIEDARDHSCREMHATAHEVAFTEAGGASLNGRTSFIEKAHDPAFDFGAGDFTISATIGPGDLAIDADSPGDIVSKFDPITRTGFTLALGASAGGYNGAGDARTLHFGIDAGSTGVWEDCGRPGGKSHNSDALTVFNGELYAGTCDGPELADWAHVYRYLGGEQWQDCGRLGDGQTRGVYAMTVHRGRLYAATSASHGPQKPPMSFGRVYRYRGGTEWEDLGQPGENFRLNALASFAGKLYVCGFNIGPDPGHVYVLREDGDTKPSWEAIGEFNGWPHSLAVHDGELFMGYPQGEVFAYNGRDWRPLGNPYGSREACNQIHSLNVFGGDLLAGTWPRGRIAALREGKWVDLGQPGDATEVIGITPYNGALYVGTIPRAEVLRLDRDPSGGAAWTSLRRLFDPEGFEPVAVGSTDWAGVADWSRASSLTVFGGKLYVTTATCHRTMHEHPREREDRGRVYSYRAGGSVSCDRDLVSNFGAGPWRVAAVRAGDELRLYIDGKLVASSTLPKEARDINVSNEAPLKIGFGPQSHFTGQIRDVRIFSRGLSHEQVAEL